MPAAETWFEVYSVIEGTLDRTHTYGDEAEADEAVARYADGLKIRGVADWQIFVLPHYCNPTDELDECVCATWLTDHHPAASSTDVIQLPYPVGS